jgi:hypothetical protein
MKGLVPSDFTIVRDPMYKYSKNAEELFFQTPTFAFFFCCFSESAAGKKFACDKIDDDNKRSQHKVLNDRMSVELATMSNKAKSTLVQHAKQTNLANNLF